MSSEMKKSGDNFIMKFSWFNYTGNYNSSICGRGLVVLILHFIFISSGYANGYLKYTEHSCIDLVPRSEAGGGDLPYARSRFPSSSGKKKRSDFDQVPYKLVVTGRRYRRNSDLIVRIEGDEFEGLLIQSRVLANTGEILRGGIGLIGQFRYLPFNFMYLPCHDIPFASVVDKGKPVKMSNVSLVWTSPDSDTGDIRFIASLLSGVHYWIIVSQILTFNPFRENQLFFNYYCKLYLLNFSISTYPTFLNLISNESLKSFKKNQSTSRYRLQIHFPDYSYSQSMILAISTYGCGSVLACFRVCPYGLYPCTSKEANYMISYTIDHLDKHEIYFTIGGRLPTNNEYHSLTQADLVVCYLERGRARIEHLLIESIQLPPYKHNDIIDLDDFDIDGKTLWCRFKRPIIKGTFIDPKLSLYHFYFTGRIDYFHQTFVFPSRVDIHTSAFKRNFSTPINEIVSGSTKIRLAKPAVPCITLLTTLFGTYYLVNYQN